MKKYLGFLPLLIILIIQFFDKEDDYFYIQIIALIIGVLFVIAHLYNKNRK